MLLLAVSMIASLSIGSAGLSFLDVWGILLGQLTGMPEGAEWTAGEIAVVTIATFIGVSFATVATDAMSRLAINKEVQMVRLMERLPRGAKLYSFGAVDHAFGFYYGGEIRHLFFPTPETVYPADFEYFCFNLSDFPEPETPVTQVKRPSGNSASTFLRLLPVAPTTLMMRFGSRGVRRRGSAIWVRPERYLPVNESGWVSISLGVPCATISPP